MQNNLFIDKFFYVGTVKQYDRKTRKLAVYIPKLMPAIPQQDNSIKEIPVINNFNSRIIKYEKSIKLRNSFWVSASDINEALPDIGSKVLIYFIEGNIRSGFWLPFNPFGESNIIEEEKYPKQFSLILNGNQIDVNKDDVVSIDLDHKVIFKNPTKNKKLKEFLIPNQGEELKSAVANQNFKMDFSETNEYELEIVGNLNYSKSTEGMEEENSLYLELNNNKFKIIENSNPENKVVDRLTLTPLIQDTKMSIFGKLNFRNILGKIFITGKIVLDCEESNKSYIKNIEISAATDNSNNTHVTSGLVSGAENIVIVLTKK